jgi:hypothetical protein
MELRELSKCKQGFTLEASQLPVEEIEEVEKS